MTRIGRSGKLDALTAAIAPIDTMTPNDTIIAERRSILPPPISADRRIAPISGWHSAD
jgi:hypothetical protein